MHFEDTDWVELEVNLKLVNLVVVNLKGGMTSTKALYIGLLAIMGIWDIDCIIEYIKCWVGVVNQ